MSRTDLADNICTIARAVELFGDAWSLMLLREMFLRVRRFDELQALTGASPATLSQRLKRLEAAGVVRREAYSERPPRYEYRLTEMGRDLWPVLVAMKAWGDRWFAHTPQPVEIVHKGCGHKVMPRMVCPECHEPMQAHDAEPRLSDEFRQERTRALEAS
ncbi:MAG: helix-turn-helix transcriptional regulator [Alphaproteobacteria bacterium]|nr:helix-turn-helix transcriptional regulator [Alphaproteobacteria bacterium]